MLVLLSFALVLVATVLLVLGLLNDDGINLIYLSIASSVAAAIVLMVALRLNKPRADQPAGAAAPEPDLAPVAPLSEKDEAEKRTERSDAPQEAAVTQGEWSAETWDDGAEEAEVDFPIADYDTLSVNQILPLLPQLYADEIDVVEQREASTKNRREIIRKLGELRSGAATGSAPDDTLAGYSESGGSAGWDSADDDWFPIEDYETLSAAQIRPLLSELDDEELGMVRAKEASLGGRRSLLDDIDRLLGGAAPASTRAPSQRTTPTKRTTKKAAAQRSTAKKSTAKKSTAKKAAATKSTAKKATTKKAAAKKSTTKKAAAKKSTATKATTKKSTAKKAAAKKAPAKKATKATKKR